MKKQEAAFNRLHALVPAQKQKGETMTESVLEISERLNAEARGQRGKNFYQEFQSLVGLVGASPPFDMETQGAADIAVIITTKDADEMKRAPDDKTPTKTQAIYELALGQIRDEVGSLKDWPSKGVYVRELEELQLDQYRELLAGQHRIIVERASEAVYVHIVCHTSRDLEALLRRRLLAG